MIEPMKNKFFFNWTEKMEEIKPRGQDVWQKESVVHTFLEEFRSFMPFAKYHLEIICKLLQQANFGKGKILDIGCGDGILSRALLDVFPDAEACLVDFSPAMLSLARERMKLYEDRTTIINADVCSPNWLDALADSNEYSAVVSGFCIHHVPNSRKQALYSEIFDLLTEGAPFIHLEHVASSSDWSRDVMEHFMVSSMLEWESRKERPASVKALRQTYLNREDKQANILESCERQCEWLKSLGYKDVEIFFKWFEIAIFGGIKRNV